MSPLQLYSTRKPLACLISPWEERQTPDQWHDPENSLNAPNNTNVLAKAAADRKAPPKKPE